MRIKLMLIICLVLTIGLLCYGACREKNRFKSMVESSVWITFDNGGFGSGIIFKDNLILTAGHCVKDINEVTIELSDGRVFKSTKFYKDEFEDVGFICIEIEDEMVVNYNNILKLGDEVYLVGTPYDEIYKFSLFDGIISYFGRDIEKLNWHNLIQTSIDGGMGCSGGGLFDKNGNLIGMYVGQCRYGGDGISLYETLDSIMEAYQRFLESEI